MMKTWRNIGKNEVISNGMFSPIDAGEMSFAIIATKQMAVWKICLHVLFHGQAMSKIAPFRGTSGLARN